MNAPQFNGGPGEVSGDDRHESGNGMAVRYRCRECRWTGRSAQAAEHHLENHHVIEAVELRSVAQFSCCANGKPNQQKVSA